MRKHGYYFVFLVLAIGLVSLANSQDDLSKWRAQLAEKSQQIGKIEADITRAQEQYQQVVANCETAEKDVKNAENENNRTKDAYDWASHNIALISPDTLNKLTRDYQAADRRYKSVQSELQQLENEKRKLNQEIERLKKTKTEKETEELELKAAMFDEEMSKPVWSEGHGEAILAEDRSHNECKELALSYARRDAMEKGGKMILRSLTEIEEFKLVKDQITTEANVQVIAQSDSGDFGKVIRHDFSTDQGIITTFSADVRLRLQSIGAFNPFRDRLNQLTPEYEQKRELIPSQIKSLDVPDKRIGTLLCIRSAYVMPEDPIDATTIGFGGGVNLGKLTDKIGWGLWGLDVLYWSKTYYVPGVDGDVEWKYSEIAIKINGKYYIATGSFKPYVGGGLGMHLYSSEYKRPAYSVGSITFPETTVSANDSKYGFQFFGGAELPLSEKMGAFMEAEYDLADIDHIIISGGVVIKLGG